MQEPNDASWVACVKALKGEGEGVSRPNSFPLPFGKPATQATSWVSP